MRETERDKELRFEAGAILRGDKLSDLKRRGISVVWTEDLKRLRALEAATLKVPLTPEELASLRRWVAHEPPFPTSSTAKDLVARLLPPEVPGG